ncbi:MAG TPA: GNAT family N-acetyltransferase [Solirubrobacteraceae bacterium]|nr:GNAT family N-acetyltransferase [Solirubrobacteraceae bacterium]
MGISRHRLKDGSEATIRPIAPEDKESLGVSFGQLSSGSRSRRFHSAPAGLSDRELGYLTEVDHHDHGALVAQRAATGEILGVARFVRSAGNPALAEVEIAVFDSAQRRGLGRALMHRLVERARQEGTTALTGIALAHNQPMFALLRGLGTTTTTRAGIGTVRLTVRLSIGDPVEDLALAA